MAAWLSAGVPRLTAAAAPRPPGESGPPARALLVVLGVIALLGNGQKALVTSTVLVSEGSLATFLRMSPEAVAALLQVLIAGMVVALALCPLLLQRTSARALGLAACAIAAVAFGAFAAIDLAGAAQPWRVLGAFVGLSVGAGALALLAPVAQAYVARAPTPGQRTSLTTLWTLAAAAGFLVAPQLVKLALPDVGLGRYFLGLAALPLLMAAAIALAPRAGAGGAGGGATGAALPVRTVLAFVAFVVAFELWTGIGDVAGFTRAPALVALAACAITLAWLVVAARAAGRPPALAGSTAWLLAALFLLQVPTTGFFDTAFLVAHGHAQAFVADRATLGASAQIAGTLVAGALAHRRPQWMPALRMAFAAIAIVGVALFLGYPWVRSVAWIYAAPVVTGFGAAGLTVLVCLALVHEAVRHPVLAAFPSMAIMLGTEFGLEALQMVYAAARVAGAGADARYAAVFAAQLAFALLLPLLLVAAARCGAQVAPPAPAAGGPAVPGRTG